MADRTVTFMDYVTPLTGVSATLVSFSGQQAPVVFGVKTKLFTIDGAIDRVTRVHHHERREQQLMELTCRPATRLF